MAELRRKIGELEMDEAERSRRVDTLNYQIRELERADLKPGGRTGNWTGGASFCAAPGS